jgi:hypothetical protein
MEGDQTPTFAILVGGFNQHANTPHLVGFPPNLVISCSLVQTGG